MTEKEMQRNELLLKLVFAKGISILNKWKVLKVAMDLDNFLLSAEDVLLISGNHRFAGVLKTSWQTLTTEKIAEKMAGQHFISYFDSDYPTLLKEIPQPPLGLFYVGNLDLLKHPLVAFVGSRDATEYGRKIVETFLPGIVQENFGIVSGLAKGIDSYSHHGAISEEGYTIGVLGCGVDICYPRESYPVYAEMLENHLIISEYPAGTSPRKHHFPMRNRLIAGLCTGICVVEAKERSGSLITAQQALEFGREVFAFPGDVLSGRSNGCHRLIQDGAKCVVSINDILDELPCFDLVH